MRPNQFSKKKTTSKTATTFNKSQRKLYGPANSSYAVPCHISWRFVERMFRRVVQEWVSGIWKGKLLWLLFSSRCGCCLLLWLLLVVVVVACCCGCCLLLWLLLVVVVVACCCGCCFCGVMFVVFF